MINKSEKGSFTIEALISLTAFMLAFTVIISLATVARVESITQYAINQVAKEVSQYYYIMYRLGITPTDTEGVQEVDDMVQAIFDFTDTTTDKVDEYSGGKQVTDLLNKEGVDNLKNDINDIKAASENLCNSITPILENPKGIVTSLITMTAKSFGNEAFTRVVAQPFCKALTPKYITSDGDADALLEKMGVIDGLDGLDFRMSSFLRDQRSINVIVVYKVKVNGFGLFDQTLTIKQSASTAAWVKGKSISDVAVEASKWGGSNFNRGKGFVEEVKNDKPDQAVKSGQGIDMYDIDTNTFTSVHSMDVFSASYSEYYRIDVADKDPDNYVFKEDKIKSTVKGYCNSLRTNMNKVGDTLEMEAGGTCQTAPEEVMHRKGVVILVVPDEARKNSDNLAILNRIAQEVEAETGIKVSITYRDSALS